MKPLTQGLLVFLAGAALVAAPEVSLAGRPTPGPAPAAPTRSISVGAPNEGSLIGGVRLEPSESLKILPGHERRWGTAELVGMLQRSAERVAKRFPGSVLHVGDLSQRGGGDVDGHRSHESGRDADVAFYVTDSKGKPRAPGIARGFDERGVSQGREDVRFDDRRNWALVEAWLTDPTARVHRIFVAEHLRKRLLDEARRRGVTAAVRARAESALFEPKGLSHDDHFHVRIGCPDRQAGQCVEFVTNERARPRAPAKRAASIARVRRRGGTTGVTPPPAAGIVRADGDFVEDGATAQADDPAR